MPCPTVRAIMSGHTVGSKTDHTIMGNAMSVNTHATRRTFSVEGRRSFIAAAPFPSSSSGERSHGSRRSRRSSRTDSSSSMLPARSLRLWRVWRVQSTTISSSRVVGNSACTIRATRSNYCSTRFASFARSRAAPVAGRSSSPCVRRADSTGRYGRSRSDDCDVDISLAR